MIGVVDGPYYGLVNASNVAWPMAPKPVTFPISLTPRLCFLSLELEMPHFFPFWYGMAVLMTEECLDVRALKGTKKRFKEISRYFSR
jgi:hypothetical protein